MGRARGPLDNTFVVKRSPHAFRRKAPALLPFTSALAALAALAAFASSPSDSPPRALGRALGTPAGPKPRGARAPCLACLRDRGSGPSSSPHTGAGSGKRAEPGESCFALCRRRARGWRGIYSDRNGAFSGHWSELQFSFVTFLCRAEQTGTAVEMTKR